MKNSKKRSAIASKIPGMMDGGRANPAMLGFGMARGAGDALAGRSAQVNNAIASATVAQARPASAPAGAGGLSRIRDGATPPAAMLAAQRRGMADGGLKRGNSDKIETGDGGPVKGPGGPTDDRVGPVALSNTEYVLPGDTVQAMGGPEALDQIRAATHKFVDPANKPSIAKGLKNGGYVVNEMPVEEISMGHSRADRAAIDKAVQSGQRAPGMAKNPARTPALDQISAKMQATPAKPGMMKSIGAGATLAAVPMAVMQGAQMAGADIPDAAVQHPLEFIGPGIAQAYADNMPEFMGGLPKSTVDAARAAGVSAYEGTRFDVNQPAAAQPAAAPAQPPNAAAQAPQAAPAGGTTPPSMPTIGKINVSRQPNGVMSFSGSGPVQGYEGAAAGQMKGGTLNVISSDAMKSASPAVSAELQAARAAAAARGDYQSAIDSITAEQNGFKQPEGGKRIAMNTPRTFGEMMQFRAQMAMNRLNQRADEATMHSENDRARIAAGLVQSPYDQERTRGAKIENDRASMLSGLVSDYMGAKDDKTRNAALAKLNALNGKDGADKYITVDMEAGVDAMGNPIIRKVPFNTRTGQIVDVSGGGAQAAKNGTPHPDGTKLRGPDGKAYEVVNGEPVLIQ